MASGAHQGPHSAQAKEKNLNPNRSCFIMSLKELKKSFARENAPHLPPSRCLRPCSSAVEDELESHRLRLVIAMDKPDPEFDMRIPLCTACDYGRYDVAQKMIDQQMADVLFQDKKGRSPIHVAGPPLITLARSLLLTHARPQQLRVCCSNCGAPRNN